MNKTNRCRAGVIFGIITTVIFILQNILTNDSHTSKEIMKSVVSGVVTGIISGVLFGLIMGAFNNSKFVKDTTKIDTDPGEEIVFESLANHFKGLEGVGGKLYLTNKRLIFKSHKFNIQNHQLSIDLSDINSIKRYKTLGVINNGLTIITNHNTTEKFVVEQTDQWQKFMPGRNNVLQN